MVVFPSLILLSQRWPQWYLQSLMLICSGLATHPSSDGDHFSTLKSEPESGACDCYTNKIRHRWCAISRPKLNWPLIASVSSLLEDMLWGHHSPRENLTTPKSPRSVRAKLTYENAVLKAGDDQVLTGIWALGFSKIEIEKKLQKNVQAYFIKLMLEHKEGNTE